MTGLLSDMNRAKKKMQFIKIQIILRLLVWNKPYLHADPHHKTEAIKILLNPTKDPAKFLEIC